MKLMSGEKNSQAIFKKKFNVLWTLIRIESCRKAVVIILSFSTNDKNTIVGKKYILLNVGIMFQILKSLNF